MSHALQIVRYIVENNSWAIIPKRLVQAFVYQCYKRFTQKTIIKTLFNGSKIVLFRHNPVASAFVYTDVPDKAEIDLLRSLADNQTIFLDIGANIGAYSLLMCDKAKAIYAFEAHPKTAELCKQNFKLNNLAVENVLTFAVSNDNQAKLFTNLSEGQPTNSRSNTVKNTIHVPAMTLDEFVEHQRFDRETPFLVKIDVEGFEHEVFAGAKSFFSNYKIKGIVFENFSSEQKSILTMLQEWGYKTQLIGKHNTFAYPKGSEFDAQ